MNDEKSVYDRFLKFRAVIIQAIALGWEDEGFRQLLNDDPRKALREAFDYDCPFDIDMETNPRNAAWNKTVQGDWLVYKQNELRMVLPPKPDRKEEEALALADFNTKHITFLG